MKQLQMHILESFIDGQAASPSPFPLTRHFLQKSLILTEFMLPSVMYQSMSPLQVMTGSKLWQPLPLLV